MNGYFSSFALAEVRVHIAHVAQQNPLIRNATDKIRTPEMFIFGCCYLHG